MKVTERDNNYAITTQQLAESVQRSAGAAQTYGSTLERTIGYTTAIGEVTRESGSVIGNSLKSIYSRITSIPKAVDALNDIGISVKDSADEMRSFDDIIDDLGSQWGDLSDEQRQNLGLQIAGRYQLSRFLILMERYGDAVSATETATNSQGSAMRENQRYLESYEAKINMMKNAWTETTIEMQDAFLGDAIVGFTTTATSAIGLLSKLIENFGLLPPLLSLAGLAMTGFGGKMKGLDLLRWNSEFDRIRTSLIEQGRAGRAGSLGLNMYTGAVTTATVATNVFAGALQFLARAFLPMAIFAGIGWGISKITEKFVDSKQKADELSRSVERINDVQLKAFTDPDTNLEETIRRYRELNEQKSNLDWNNEKEREYVAIQNEIGQILPNVVKGITDKGDRHLDASANIEEEVEATRELIKAQQELAVNEYKDVYSDDQDNISDRRNQEDELRKTIKAIEDGIRVQKQRFDGGLMNEDTFDMVVKDAEAQLRVYKNQLVEAQHVTANATQIMASHIENQFTTTVNILDQEVIPQIRDVGVALLNAIDFTDVNATPDQLFGIINELGQMFKELDDIFADGDEGAFQERLDSIVSFMNSEFDFAISEDIIPTYEHVLEAKEKNITVSELLTSLLLEEQDGHEGAGDAVSDHADEINKLSDAYHDAIGQIEGLNGILNDLDDGDLSMKSINFMLENYPQLLPYMEDEIMLREMINLMIEDQTELAQEEVDVHLEGLQTKLMNDEEYIKYIVKSNGELFDIFKDNYGVDLSNFVSLAKAKEEVENRLLKSLTDKWNEYVSGVKLTASEMGTLLDSSTGRFTDKGREEWKKLSQEEQREFGYAMAAEQRRIEGLNKALDTIGKTEFTGSNANFEGIGRSIRDAGRNLDKASKAGKKAKKSAKDTAREHQLSTYIADAYARALEEINLALERQNKLASEFPKHSKEYRDSLNEEIKLLKSKESLLKSQSGELERQIRSGNIQQTGVVRGGSVSTASGGSYSGQYSSQINRASQQHGVDPNLIAAIIRHESNFNSRAVSHAGAQGLMQLMPATGRGLGVTNPFDPAQNIMGGTKYIAQQLRAFGGNIEMALAAYNAGPGNVRKHGGIPPFRETQNYVKRVMGTYGGGSGKVSGKANDDWAKNQSDASSAEAQRLSDLDSARSDLLGLESDMLSIGDQINDLYFSIVESHLAEFDHTRSKLDKRLAEIEYFQSRYDEGSVEWMEQQIEREEVLRNQNKAHKDSIKWLEREIRSNKSLTKAQKMRLDDLLIERQTEMWNLEKQILDERVKMANQLLDVYKQTLNAQKDAALKAVDNLLKEIDEKEREADYKKRLEKEQKSRQEILDEISEWSIDDSDQAKKRIRELTEQLQEIDEAIEEMQHSKEIDDRKDALNEEKENINERYDNLLNDEQAFANMRSNIIKGNTKSIERELSSFYTKLNSMTDELGSSVVKNLQRAINQMNSYIKDPNFKNVKIPHFDTGGRVRTKSSSGGLIVAHDKEIVLKEDDSRNLLDTIGIAKDLFSHIRVPKAPQLAHGSTTNSVVYDIDLHVGNMSGTKDDARFVLGEIVRGVKSRGGRI